MIQRWKNWRKQSQYREVTRVCLPLVLGMSATTIMEFTDRVFLSNYSLDAVAAALPAGISAFLFMAFLGGIGGYTSVFIAQYTGRGDHKMVGVVLWQGIYFTLLSGIIFWIIALTTGSTLFKFFDHPPNIQILEEQYYTILCKGGIFHVALNTLSTFFSGRGRTKPVMTMYIIGMLINIPLDYSLIYGKFGLPEMGIQGAAIATVTASFVPSLFLLGLIFTKNHNQRFGVLKNWQFNPAIFKRLLRFGIPGSIQFTLDILAFTFFTLMVGRLGTVPMAATTVVISINAVAFMPSMGVSQGLSILVGQALGEKNKNKAKSNVWSAAHLLVIYILLIDILFVFFPEILLSLFIPETTTTGYLELQTMSVNLLKIIAAYLLLDSFYMIFTGSLRGAGDNKFIMWCIGIASVLFLMLPCYIGIEYFEMGIYFAWFCILAFIASLFIISAFRFRQGKWLDMLVIESESE